MNFKGWSPSLGVGCSMPPQSPGRQGQDKIGMAKSAGLMPRGRPSLTRGPVWAQEKGLELVAFPGSRGDEVLGLGSR